MFSCVIKVKIIVKVYVFKIMDVVILIKVVDVVMLVVVIFCLVGN